MYLKSIEIQGFKSFAGKTLLSFHDGITGIVGPNGSGKSNVADAVRWVLGEQRVKQLRGGSMQDVIFAGTQNRKPLGFAAVSITLDNSDHALPVSYNEVTVTRRLYRSGESEYLINGTGCRLKDINELFYDTGVGKEGYSIIGQGQIEAILSGKPEERRELFDEAAGIVKFKRRKLEAVKKLENEQQNLIRISDIVSELERQIGPLQRASEKAKVYLKMRDELKAYDVNLFIVEYTELKEKLEKLKADSEAASEHLAQVRSEAEAIREEYDQTSTSVDELTARQTALSEQLTADKLACSQWEGQIKLLQEQIRLSGEGEKQNEKRIAQLNDLIEEKREEITGKEELCAKLEEEIEACRKKIASLEEELSGARDILQNAEVRLAAIEEEKKDLSEKEREIGEAIASDSALLEQLRKRRQVLKDQSGKLLDEEEGRRQVLEQIRAEREGIDREIEQLENRSSEAGDALSRTQDELSGLNTEFEKAQVEFHRDSSRLESLKNIAERYDGYGNSIRRVMEQRGRESGILGVVADLISTDEEYETAIETALGAGLQNIVTEDEETAKRMIRFLREGKHGRATFLPLTAMHPWEFNQRSALREQGVVGLASALVDCEPKYNAMVGQLLGRTLVVDHIDNAVIIARKYRYSLRIVTLDGESLSPGGAMTGGAFKNSSNLLGRRREIEKLKEIVENRREALEDLKTRIDSCRDKRNALRDLIRDLSVQLQEHYLRQNTAKMKEQDLSGQSSRTRDVREQTILEEQDLARQIKNREDALSDNEKKREEILRRAGDLDDLEEQIRQEISEAHSKEAAASDHISAGRITLSSHEQKLEFLLSDTERLSGEKASFEQELKEIEDSRKKSVEDLKAKEEQIEQLGAQREKKQEDIDTLSKTIADMQEKREKLSSRMRELFDQRESLTETIALLEKECYRFTSQIEKAEEKREERIAYMWDTYELTYSSALPQKRDDLGSRSEWKKRMNSLKAQIRELGNVNVGSIEEYKEVSERYKFLSAQQEDLIRAQKDLERIIGELDNGMRKQFREKFELIRASFNKTFSELFGGGEGHLELTDDDILEAGIRIIAQPPGKKLQNMMQMSGGEKALTAIALLFGIQNLKPSPFCLLDEIEAALDENNVVRYAAYLQKLTKNTQFIIITHRRGTMAAADRLYGITMQEKGVSALVSVNLVADELDS